jgi:hypothetical protein
LASLWSLPRHLFHASAFAVEGRVDDHQIPTQAGVVLPESGGSLSQRVERYDDGVVRFAEAISEVTGVERDGVAVTTSTVSIRDIDIMGIVHADRIVLRATRAGASMTRRPRSPSPARASMVSPCVASPWIWRSTRSASIGRLRSRRYARSSAIERSGAISDSIVRSINLASLGTTKGASVLSTLATSSSNRANGGWQ